MSLTVGELNAILTLDDRAVDPALRRAEQAMRQTGQRMGDDADDAGETAGRQLGEGMQTGFTARLRALFGRFRSAGAQAGREAGEAAGDAAGDGLNDRATSGAEDAVGGMKGKLAALGPIAATIGAAAGAVLISGFQEAMDQGKITAKLAAALGATGPEAAKYGKAAGVLFKNAVVENFQEGADAIRATASAGLVPPKATVEQLATIGTKVADLASTFGLDLGETATAVGQLIRSGMAKDATQGLDLIAESMKRADGRGDDLLETVTEYTPIFQQLGIDGKTAFGLVSQGLNANAKDSDKVADALKELSLQATSGSKAQMDALGDLGLNATKVADDIAAGGARGRKGMDQVLDALREMPASAKRAQAVQTLFGGPGEDLGAALFSLDIDKASKSMDGAAGAAGKLGDTLRDNASSQITKFKNTLNQNLVEFLGGTVIPAVTNARVVIGRELGGMWDAAGKGGAQGVDRVVAVVEALGTRLAQKAVEQAPKLISGLMGLGEKAAAYVAANPGQVFKVAAIGAALVTAFVALPALVAAGLSATAISIVVGFVSKMASSLNENLPKWWKNFTGWVAKKAGEAGTFMAGLGAAIGNWFSGLWSKYISGPVSRQWNAFLGTVKALPGRTVAALAPLAGRLLSTSSTAWQRFKDGAATKASAFVSWAKGLPGRIVAAIGNTASLLISKGRNLVQGFWSGVSGMTGWIKSKLYSWAKSAIPGPIASALGINSPSKVTKQQGRWIAQGLVVGLTGSTKQIKAASGKLSDIIADSLAPGKKRSKALGTLSAGTKRLLKLASTEEKVAARLKTAQKNLSSLIAARDKLSADVSKGVLDGANITQQSGSEGNSAESILDDLRADTVAAQRFAANLAKLRKKGVRSDLIAQIAQAGVTQGSSAAAALASASTAQVKQINGQQAALVKAANAAGATAGTAMYGAGIQAAQGLVRGLQGQQKAIERQMLQIAKAMSKSIRKALGIKSPSRVMAAVGVHTAQGLVKGIDSERAAVNRSMASLVDTPPPGQWGAYGPGSGRQQPTKLLLEMRSSGNSEWDNFIMKRLRLRIQRNHGGDVQLAIGKGTSAW